jgi:nitric oxide synthase-interacting protein
MQAFWMPSQTPGAKTKVDKPDKHTYCPASGKKLRLKDLVAVHFTPVPEGEGGLYMDPVTRETFTNSSRLVALKPTGTVMMRETYEQCVKKDGHYEGEGGDVLGPYLLLYTMAGCNWMPVTLSL